MAEAMSAAKPTLFNSPLETGVRAIVVLNAAYPRAFDVTEIAWFDHLVVHTGDIGGPQSLHPDVPQRSGELLVRRRLVEDGLLPCADFTWWNSYPTAMPVCFIGRARRPWA